MKISTAKKVLQKECDFLGIKYELLILEIKKYGSLLFSTQVMTAFVTLDEMDLV